MLKRSCRADLRGGGQPHRLPMSGLLGFKLAEVLITIGIIGLVDAMTLPSLINRARGKQLEAAFKKNYSRLYQALDMHYALTGERIVTRNDNIDGNMVKETLMKYMPVLVDCGFGYDDRDSACVSINRPAYKNFTGTTDINMECFDDGQFILTDGSMIFVNSIGACPKSISIDVNGYKKGPNRLGQDLFMFLIYEDGVFPSGEMPDRGWGNMKCSATATDYMNGGGCTIKALYDKDFFSRLP